MVKGLSECLTDFLNAAPRAIGDKKKKVCVLDFRQIWKLSIR